MQICKTHLNYWQGFSKYPIFAKFYTFWVSFNYANMRKRHDRVLKQERCMCVYPADGSSGAHYSAMGETYPQWRWSAATELFWCVISISDVDLWECSRIWKYFWRSGFQRALGKLNRSDWQIIPQGCQPVAKPSGKYIFPAVTEKLCAWEGRYWAIVAEAPFLQRRSNLPLKFSRGVFPKISFLKKILVAQLNSLSDLIRSL